MKWYEYLRLQVCHHEGCFRIVRPCKRDEHVHTLCQKHKLDVVIAASKMFNKWCKANTPRGGTPPLGPGLKLTPRVVVQRIQPAETPQLLEFWRNRLTRDRSGNTRSSENRPENMQLSGSHYRNEDFILRVPHNAVTVWIFSTHYGRHDRHRQPQ
ncbi:hypothetical protein BU25DRAFT_100100 [Macroventuria anomochaeta]|uniref:Uncharacterized protein n=1 Tax=Macroventuria anomochaeta TaxID=301207 RepID=A0ACB6RWT5_9PLEO|nr:uncharacterized protein BU25DRAFT_100100 [Macroventuria anomochaeta]KAF2626480.1 hypothetical protein BU25DRAFT_100100 [Macroventuria anomochaeta]